MERAEEAVQKAMKNKEDSGLRKSKIQRPSDLEGKGEDALPKIKRLDSGRREGDTLLVWGGRVVADGGHS